VSCWNIQLLQISAPGTNAKCRDVRYTAAIEGLAEVTGTSSN